MKKGQKTESTPTCKDCLYICHNFQTDESDFYCTNYNGQINYIHLIHDLNEPFCSNFKSSKEAKEEYKMANSKEKVEEKKTKCKIKLEISNFNDREKFIMALANNGYWVTVEEEEDWPHTTPKYYVVFTVDSDCIF